MRVESLAFPVMVHLDTDQHHRGAKMGNHCHTSIDLSNNQETLSGQSSNFLQNNGTHLFHPIDNFLNLQNENHVYLK